MSKWAVGRNVKTVAKQQAGEIIAKNLTQDQALFNRDATAKAMYQRIFGWLVTSCNNVLIDPTEDRLVQAPCPAALTMISESSLCLGLLDIFGFEVFKTNSLEQLCINITNEQVQSLDREHTADT